MSSKVSFFGIIIMLMTLSLQAQPERGWYTEGDDYAPTQRISFTVTNPLDIPIENCPVQVRRDQLPIQNIRERWINLVDPKLPENDEPTYEELMDFGGYTRRSETNGHYVDTQIDDLDKDGIWDEIFFFTNLAPRETREFYIYVGEYERGFTKHYTQGLIGYYGRHMVPMWESDYMGWKLWYPDAVDLHGKREPQLTAYYEMSTNRSGYYMPEELGSDIMTVANTFGSGSIGLVEDPLSAHQLSRPSYSPFKDKGPFGDTRYSYDVVYNGPFRSRIKVTTTNWNSGKGFYEMEQYYEAVAHKSWSAVEVKFTKFLPPGEDILFAAGIREIMNEYKSVNKEGFVISMGKDIESRIPDEDLGEEVTLVPWQGIGLIVSDKYQPKYTPIESYGGNHIFTMAMNPNRSFEYLIVGGWSFGTVNNNEKSFVEYVETETLKYNNPPKVVIGNYEKKRN